MNIVLTNVFFFNIGLLSHLDFGVKKRHLQVSYRYVFYYPNLKPFSVVLKDFMKKLEEKRVALNKAISMGEAILTNSHPDSITTVKHWNTIIKARFDEVSSQQPLALIANIEY